MWSRFERSGFEVDVGVVLAVKVRAVDVRAVEVGVVVDGC